MNIKKTLAAVAAVAPLAVLAEGEAPTIDTTALTGYATAISTAVKNLFTGPILTAVGTILGGVVVVWGLGLIWKWVKHIAGR